jgi:protein SCO1/2
VFIKIVVVLLLLIVAASLLSGRGPATARRQTGAKLRPLMKRVALVLLAIGALLAALHLSGCSQPGETFHATDITGAAFGRHFSLTDPAGRRLASADFSGKVVVIFFGYTQCPDVCPTTLTTMKETMRLLGPESDYVPWFDSRFLGLYGDARTTLETAREFHVFYSKAKSETALGYSIDHSATSYAYDPKGRLRLLIRHGEAPEHIAADLRKLLAGK